MGNDASIDLLREQLRQVAQDPEAMSKLHPLEQEMVRDALVSIRHTKCNGCRRVLEKLLAKAKETTS